MRKAVDFLLALIVVGGLAACGGSDKVAKELGLPSADRKGKGDFVLMKEVATDRSSVRDTRGKTDEGRFVLGLTPQARGGLERGEYWVEAWVVPATVSTEQFNSSAKDSNKRIVYHHCRRAFANCTNALTRFSCRYSHGAVACTAGTRGAAAPGAYKIFARTCIYARNVKDPLGFSEKCSAAKSTNINLLAENPQASQP